MNAEKIMKMLPQRYPILLIDKVIGYDKNERLVALKNVTINEEYFQGHFQEDKVMPGVLIIEAMGQAAMVFMSLNNSEDLDNPKAISLFYLSSVKARFLSPVVPGDQLMMEVTPVKMTKDAGIIKAVAKVNGKEVARAELAGVVKA